MGPGSPPDLPAALIAGFYLPCFLLHLPRKAPVSWWLGGRVTAKLGKERQCRQMGKSAQVRTFPESVPPPAYTTNWSSLPLTVALQLFPLVGTSYAHCLGFTQTSYKQSFADWCSWGLNLYKNACVHVLEALPFKQLLLILLHYLLLLFLKKALWSCPHLKCQKT